MINTSHEKTKPVFGVFFLAVFVFFHHHITLAEQQNVFITVATQVSFSHQVIFKNGLHEYDCSALSRLVQQSSFFSGLIFSLVVVFLLLCFYALRKMFLTLRANLLQAHSSPAFFFFQQLKKEERQKIVNE